MLIPNEIHAIEATQTSAAHPLDATFNNYPITLQRDKPFHSTVHCVGETHHPETAWMHRSCEFQNLCLDIKTKEFHVVASPYEEAFQQRRVDHSFSSTELLYNGTNIALGGINPRWQGKDFNQGIDKVRWSPNVLTKAPKEYYTLQSDVVFLPFHSFAAHNVGHMLWDDFLPIYTLLQLFGLMNEEDPTSISKLLLLRVDTLPLLYGTCEMQRKKRIKCAENFAKFLPLLGVDPKTFSTAKTLQFHPSPGSNATLVCAKTAAVGLGMLTDHGWKDHGWLPNNAEDSVQNTAKGPLLYHFRNFILHNLGLPIIPPPSNDLNIILSAHSSSAGGPRDVTFENQQSILKKAFPTANVPIVQLSELGVREQIELVSQKTTIFVTTCGGGSMTATFLPRGATLILYYQQTGGFDFTTFNMTGGPAYLDWDLFNNAAYIRVHWLPIETMNTPQGLHTLMYLIRHELDVTSNHHDG
jgi:hypothetical protein